MKKSTRYVLEDMSKSKNFSIQLDHEVYLKLNTYIEFLRNECGISKNILSDNDIVSDIINFGLDKYEKSSDWKAFLNQAMKGLKSKKRT